MNITVPNLPPPDPDLVYAPDDPRTQQALDLAERLWPEALRWAERVTSGWVPLRHVAHDMRGGGCICGCFAYTRLLYSTINCVEGAIEGLLHEAGHLETHDHGIHLVDWKPEALLNDPAVLYASPYRSDIRRPIGAVFQGQCSYLWVWDWYVRVKAHGLPTIPMQHIDMKLDETRRKLVAGHAILAELRPGRSERTRRYIDRMMEWSAAAIR